MTLKIENGPTKKRICLEANFKERIMFLEGEVNEINYFLSTVSCWESTCCYHIMKRASSVEQCVQRTDNKVQLQETMASALPSINTNHDLQSVQTGF